VIVLTHRRIFILPNKRGLGLALLLVIQWLAAINYSNNLAFILTFLLAAVGVVGILHSYRNLARLSIRLGHIAPVFAGDAACLSLNLENPTASMRFGLWLSVEGAEPRMLAVAAETNAVAELHPRTERRGWLEVGTIRLSSEFPLGVFHAWSPLRFQARVLAYPKPAANRLAFPVAEGQGPASQRQGPDDFHGFQAYRPGDPLRHLYWKGIAKGQDPQVKRYTGEETDSLHFDWETTPGNGVEAKLSRLCRWILDADAAGLRYGLSLPGIRIPTGCAAEHSRRCLEALALFPGRQP
jgi:uncharacterized protein (DUF58 family)